MSTRFGTVLVTGASSTVGALAVRELAAAGVPVRAASHRLRGVVEPASRVERVVFDLLDRPATSAALSGVESVLLIVPEIEDMIDMTASLVAAAVARGIRRVVKLSFLNADIGLGGPIVLWHQEADRVLTESAVPSVFLRANSLMQNALRFHAQGIMTSGVLSSPLGGGRVSFVDARDVARAAAAALLGEPRRGFYCLTGPEALAQAEIARVLTAVLGRPVHYREATEADMREAMARRGRHVDTLDALGELWRAMRADEFSAVYAHYAELTGAQPTSFKQFASDYRQAFRLHARTEGSPVDSRAQGS
jgi:uncharacterized protein YbjT (DUF2867 family)